MVIQCGGFLVHCFLVELEFCNVGFCGREENWRTWRKITEPRMRTNNKLNPHVMPALGIKPRQQRWEARTLPTVQSSAFPWDFQHEIDLGNLKHYIFLKYFIIEKMFLILRTGIFLEIVMISKELESNIMFILDFIVIRYLVCLEAVRQQGKYYNYLPPATDNEVSGCFSIK